MPIAHRKPAPKSSGPKLPAAMEARSVDAIPRGPEWQYEPKWDGFRCLLWRNGSKVALRSKSGENLTRYFPELVDGRAQIARKQPSCSTARSWSHTAMRFHSTTCCSEFIPAASRVKKLAQETPALFLAFDLLLSAKDKKLAARPLRERRTSLEGLCKNPVQVQSDLSIVAGHGECRDRRKMARASRAAAATA